MNECPNAFAYAVFFLYQISFSFGLYCLNHISLLILGLNKILLRSLTIIPFTSPSTQHLSDVCTCTHTNVREYACQQLGFFVFWTLLTHFPHAWIKETSDHPWNVCFSCTQLLPEIGCQTKTSLGAGTEHWQMVYRHHFQTCPCKLVLCNSLVSSPLHLLTDFLGARRELWGCGDWWNFVQTACQVLS